jgi:hypothetical protein
MRYYNDTYIHRIVSTISRIKIFNKLPVRLLWDRNVSADLMGPLDYITSPKEENRASYRNVYF